MDSTIEWLLFCCVSFEWKWSVMTYEICWHFVVGRVCVCVCVSVGRPVCMYASWNVRVLMKSKLQKRHFHINLWYCLNKNYGTSFSVCVCVLNSTSPMALHSVGSSSAPVSLIPVTYLLYIFNRFLFYLTRFRTPFGHSVCVHRNNCNRPRGQIWAAQQKTKKPKNQRIQWKIVLKPLFRVVCFR